MPKAMPRRRPYLIGLMITCVLLLVSFYLQLVAGYQPCPLCILQRFMFFVLGVLFLFGVLFYKKHFLRIIINLLSVVASLTGLGLAARQVWLQNFPPAGTTTECGVSIQYMLRILPLNELVEKILGGTGECAQRSWEFFYLDMAEWALVFFSLFLLGTLYLSFKEFKYSGHKHFLHKNH